MLEVLRFLEGVRMDRLWVMNIARILTKCNARQPCLSGVVCFREYYVGCCFVVRPTVVRDGHVSCGRDIHSCRILGTQLDLEIVAFSFCCWWAGLSSVEDEVM
eukprot:TRINITY_DN1386_c0_g3_i3.p2 TRINITY_DN1386_c0_g3~~TRINITY_DN1386_c0_g3_i3.p2  ORF type:complete len:103 (-),score=6.43 TRINITY_DN1386_c0_g3_i3:290-598(-)